MTKLIHAFYNMDTNSVELTYNDGSVLTIDCEEVENHYDVTNGQMADLEIGCYTTPRWSMLVWCCPGKWRTA